MFNVDVTNKKFDNNIFQKVYNFPTKDRNFWTTPNLGNDYNKNNRWQKFEIYGLLTVAGGFLFLSRGVQRKAKNILENVQEYLGSKQNKYFFDDSKPKVPFYDYTLRKINSFIRKTESINNINSIKDMLFMKFMYRTNFGKAIHKGISDFFEFLSRNTVIKSYKKTQKYFDEIFANFDRFDEYILKHSANEYVEFNGEKLLVKDLIKEARNKRSIVKTVVDIFIDKAAQDERYNYIKKSTSTLYSKIWNSSFKDFWTKDNKFKRKEMWQTFIAAEQIKANKTELNNCVSFSRNLLSYTDAEKKSYILTFINNLNCIIPANDTTGIEILERLKWYVKDSASLTRNKEKFLKELDKLEKHDIGKACGYEKSLLEDKNTNIHLIRNIFKEDAKGDIETILDIYREIAPIELAKSGTLKSVEKAIASFDKSIKLEINELFDKLRDLEIGSAPTDLLTILISSSLIIYALEKAKNKEERTSILLKSGIPIAGAITVTLFSAAKLVSGSKSLLLGFLSGIILNRIGKAVDVYHKKTVKSS